jgi:hypothetical protein
MGEIWLITAVIRADNSREKSGGQINERKAVKKESKVIVFHKQREAAILGKTKRKTTNFQRIIKALKYSVESLSLSAIKWKK